MRHSLAFAAALTIATAAGLGAIGASPRPQTVPPQAVPPPQTAPPQTVPPPAPPAPAAPHSGQVAPVFRGGVDLVHLDVTVLDKARRPVRGLAPEDFTVLDDGTPETIAAFSPVDVKAAAPAPVAWLRDVAPDVRSNDMSDTRLFVVVLDDALIPGDADTTKRAKQIVHDFVDKLGPTDLASIVLTGDNRSAQNFTNDHAQLLAVLDKFSPGLAHYDFGYSAGGAASAGVSGGVSGDEQFFEMAIDTLSNVADYLVQVPDHRKALVWISPGIPIDPSVQAPTMATGDTSMSGREAMSRLVEEIPDILERAQRSNVAVYPIDPTGPGGMERYIASRIMGRMDGASAMAFAHRQATLQLDNVEQIAANTGGVAAVNTNDYSNAISQIYDETSSYYLLGLQPVNMRSDGKLHRVEVKVDRPDVEVRTRSGYYAPQPIKVSEAAKSAAVSPLATAMASILPNPDMPMQVTVAPFLYATPPAIPLDPKVAAGAAAAAKTKGKAPKAPPKPASNAHPPTSTVAVTLGVRQKAREDSATGPVVEDVDLETSAFTPEGMARGTSRQIAHIALRSGATGEFGYEVVTHIDLMPGRYELRLATYSDSLEKTGSVFTDVVVPDFANAPLSMSGVIVNRDPAIPWGPKGAVPAALPFAPTTDRDFIVSDKVTAFMRVYEGGKAKFLQVPLDVKIVDTADKAVVQQTDAIDASKFDATTRGADYSYVLPLDTLPAGEYLLTFTATLGGDRITRDVRFTLH